MSNVKALDKLRTVIKLDSTNCYTVYEFYDALDKCVDEIEREVSERFVERGADSFEIQTVFGMSLDEIRQMMKRDAERRQTCKVKSKIFIEGEYVPCPYYEYEMECGGQFRWDEPEPPSYCPCCGAKVVEGDA